jgi:hypothetical protein
MWALFQRRLLQLRGSTATADTPSYICYHYRSPSPPGSGVGAESGKTTSLIQPSNPSWLVKQSFGLCSPLREVPLTVQLVKAVGLHRHRLAPWIELSDQTFEQPLIYTGNPIPEGFNIRCQLAPEDLNRRSITSLATC